MKVILILGIFLLAYPGFGKDVVMAFGEKNPPFCFPESNSGIEVEIYREALAYKGHKLIPRYYPFARIPVAFKEKKVDAAMTDLGENMESVGAHLAAADKANRLKGENNQETQVLMLK